MQKPTSFSKLFLTFVICINGSYYTAAQACSSDFLSALRELGYERVSDDVALTLRKRLCSNRSSSGTFRFVDDSTKFNVGSKSVSEACRSDDTEYFRQYEREIAFSRISDRGMEVAAACVGGNVIFTGASSEDNLNLRVAYQPIGNGNLAKLSENLSWTPTDAVDCQGLEWKDEMTLRPGGNMLSCTRKKNVAITFTLTSDVGAKQVYFDRRFFFEAFRWKIESSGGRFKCVNQYGGGDSNWVNYKGNLNPSQETGWCLVNYGYGVVHYGDQINENERKPLFDLWEANGEAEGSPISTCYLNKEKVGVFNVKDYGVDGLGPSHKYICASLFGRLNQ